MRMTKRHKDFIRENHKGLSNKELTEKLNEEFNTNITVMAVESYRYYHNLRNDRHINPNKTKEGEITYHLKSNGKRAPVIKQDGEFKMLKHVVYEREYGEKIKDGYVIICLDGDENNLDKDNLVMVNNGAHLHVKADKDTPPELKRAMYLVNEIRNDTGKLKDKKALKGKPKIKYRNTSRKLSDKQAIKAREEYKQGATMSELARKYNLNKNAMWKLIRGRTYKDLL